MEWQESIMKIVSIIAVSYTHLDVYKRQEYYDLAMKDGFESVFHKVKEGYEIQNEVRFAVINPDKPEHCLLYTSRCV